MKRRGPLRDQPLRWLLKWRKMADIESKQNLWKLLTNVIFFSEKSLLGYLTLKGFFWLVILQRAFSRVSQEIASFPKYLIENRTCLVLTWFCVENGICVKMSGFFKFDPCAIFKFEGKTALTKIFWPFLPTAPRIWRFTGRELEVGWERMGPGEVGFPGDGLRSPLCSDPMGESGFCISALEELGEWEW